MVVGGSVFLTDGQQRKTLAAARSLAGNGIDPHVGEVTLLNPSMFSRHCRGRLVYPSPAVQPDEWVDAVASYIRRKRIECIFPMDDVCLALVSERRAEFEGLCAVPLPPRTVLESCLDKAGTIEAARRAGLRHPRTLVVPGGAPGETAADWDGGFPAVVRPRRSSGSRGLRVASGPAELDALMRDVSRRYPGGVLVQEYVPPGRKYDVCVLVDWSGKMVASFVQREMRCFPIPHGPSTLQESLRRPDLVEASARLLREVNWTGLAEVEFMEDPRDGGAVLMEVNPRFWGSLHLAVVCGVDFPRLLYLLATGRRVPEAHEYPAGRRCRWLLPGDMLHFLANPDRWRMSPPFFQFFERDTVDDTLSLSDPGPALGFALAALRYAIDPGMWEFIFHR